MKNLLNIKKIKVILILKNQVKRTKFLLSLCINLCISDILMIGLFTYLSGGEDYEDMVLFAESNKDFIRKFCVLPNEILSHYTFNRAFSTIKIDI